MQQKPQKKVPVRRCVGCNTQKPKKELVRIVRSPEGEVSVDLTGKRSGRGAYLCPSAACLAKARKAKRLEHAFGVPVPDEVFERLTEQMARCAEMLFGEKSVYRLHEGGMGSEDFASYTYELPCAYLLLGAGTAQEDARYGKPMHNESVVFNENILPRGSALLAYGAMQWLEDQE